MKTCSSIQTHCKDTDSLVARKYRSNSIDVGAEVQTMGMDFPVATVLTKPVLHAKGQISTRER